jgi:LacI family transcriptional regulator
MQAGSDSTRTTGSPPRVVLLLESSRASGRALLRGVAHYAQLHGPWSFYWEPAGLNQAWPMLRTLDADGIILRDLGQVEEVVASGIPAVVVGHSREEFPGLVNVVTDSAAIGRMAAEHLLDCGLRHFGYCGLAHSGIERTPWSQQRAESFTQRLSESALTARCFEPPPAESSGPGTGPALGEELERIAQWLKGLPKPVGVMACNDDRGQQVIEACRLALLSVPDEVAVIGVDNDELICGFSNPPFSSVALNFERAGYQSAEALHRLIRGQKPVPAKIVVRPTHVVMRHASNILAVEDPLVARALRTIRDGCHRQLSVADVARTVAVSRRALEQRFRHVLARSILTEIRRARVGRIAQMLAATTLSIAEIADQLGFDGPQHIARYFRAEKGLTPREFRRRLQPN